MKSLVALASAALMCATARAAAPPSPDEVLGGIRAGLPALAEAERAAGAYRCAQSQTIGGKTTATTLTIRRDADRVLLDLPKGRCVLGDGLAFAVQRNPKTKEWSLVQSAKANPLDAFRKMIPVHHLAVFPLTAVSEDTLVADLIGAPAFRATGTTARPDGLLDLTYTSALGGEDGGTPLTVTGTLTVSPKHDYLIVRSTQLVANSPIGFPVRTVVSRELPPNAPLRCAALTVSAVNAKTEREHNGSRYVFTYGGEPAPDPAEFGFEHYKIPAPVFDTPEDAPPSRWH